MKSLLGTSVVALGLLALASGCEHLDLTPAGDPERVLNGAVTLPSALPAGTEVVVRIVDLTPSEIGLVTPKDDLPITDRARPVKPERVLGESR